MGEAYWRSLKRFDDIRKEEGEEGKVEENGAEEYFNSLLELEQTPSLLVCEPFRGQARCPGSAEPPGGSHSSCILPEGRAEWCHGHGQGLLVLGHQYELERTRALDYGQR